MIQQYRNVQNSAGPVQKSAGLCRTVPVSEGERRTRAEHCKTVQNSLGQCGTVQTVQNSVGLSILVHASAE